VQTAAAPKGGGWTRESLTRGSEKNRLSAALNSTSLPGQGTSGAPEADGESARASVGASQGLFPRRQWLLENSYCSLEA